MRNIDVMLSKPGIWVLFTDDSAGFVEVDERGACFQLEIVSGIYRRDGELRAGGWNLDAIRAIHGPFARSAAP